MKTLVMYHFYPNVYPKTNRCGVVIKTQLILMVELICNIYRYVVPKKEDKIEIQL